MDRAAIINSMLSVVGESGVSASTSTHPSVQTASRILDTENLDFQQTGWWFNREYNLTLVPNSEGRVTVPASALDLQITGVQNKSAEEKMRYTRRTNYIYDTIKHTDVLNVSVVVDVVTLLSIDSLPSVAASYLLHRARESMYVDDDGDNFKTQKLMQDRADAWQRLTAAKLRIEAPNALDNRVAQTLMSGTGGTLRTPNIMGGSSR